jgi:hypothetical protein
MGPSMQDKQTMSPFMLIISGNDDVRFYAYQLNVSFYAYHKWKRWCPLLCLSAPDIAFYAYQNDDVPAVSHGSGGILILSKWRDLLKACCRSKQRQKLVTWSYSHSNRLMAQRYKYVYTPRMMGNSYAEYPPPQRLKFHRYYRQNPYAHREI